MNQKKGFASTIMLLGLVIIGALCVAAANMSVNSIKVATSNRDEQIAVQAAQAGLEQATARAFASLNANNGAFVTTTYNDMGTVLNPIASGCTATATIQPQANNTYAYVTSTVTYKNFTKSFRSVIKCKNVGVWNNAIFAGVGASGQAINGNVQIRGSVHILGDGEPYVDAAGIGTYFAGDPFTDSNHNGVWDPGEPYTDVLHVGHYVGPDPYNDLNGNGVYDPPLTQTSLNDTMSGTAYIGNNYDQIPAGLSTVIPAAPTVNGIQTLSAEMRAKHGQVSINGNASIGTNSIINGGMSKSTMDGMYVSDGYTGNQGAAHVYSDNGTTNGYDLGALGITFPIISGIGSQQYVDGSGNTWNSMTAYYSARSLSVNINTITASTTAFSYGPDQYGNKISFTPKTNNTAAVLTVTGIVSVPGNLQIGAKDTITYKGNGTIYSPGNINIDGNLTPASGQVFPTTTALGWVAKGNINLATGNGSSQLTMAGAFYAQDTIVSAKQNNIAGTFVASYFNMGNNVPSIFQVPSLATHLPPGMPGGNSYFTLQQQGWRER
ncbi:MAG: hypothetical protein JSS72_04940 [Armatimonadetes bacterium]|nr:hypothetical protein [Armatimonadota bacterium]